MREIFGDERVERALLDQMRRVLRRTIRTSPLGLVAFPVVTWRHVEHRWLLLYFGLTTAVSCLTELQFFFQQRNEQKGETNFLRFQRQIAANMIVTSAIWGSISWMVGGAPEWVGALAAVYLIAFIAANMVFNAPSNYLFLIYQVPLVSSAVVGFLAFGGPTGRTWALVLVGFACSSAIMHKELHTVFRGAVRREVMNFDLTLQLQARQLDVERSNELLLHEATHDSLTGLPNRALFSRMLEAAVAEANNDGQCVSILLIDVDRFKVVNDSLGHGAGDELLVEFALRCKAQLGSQCTMARLGGDEFAVVVGQRGPSVDVQSVGERFMQVCREPFMIGGRPVPVTISIGSSQGGDKGEAAMDLLRQADVALYRAKQLGRDRSEQFDDSLRDEMDRKLDREIEVRAAIALGELVAHFQPVVHLASRRIVAVEALVRWNHPTQGLLPPGRFLETLEECGLGPQLLTVMVRNAAELLHDAARLGIVLPPGFRVWVNFDPRSALRDMESIERLASEIGLDVSMLGVEVTERSVLDDIEGAAAVLNRLKAAGVESALDDFGTGHSSLSLLQRLPVDAVKIDRSFVRDIVDDPRDLLLVTAIAGLAADLGLGVVAEGVETVEQQHLLCGLGVGKAQGFLYSPAVEPAQLLAWLRDGVPWETVHENRESLVV